VAAEVGAYSLVVRWREDACGAVRFIALHRAEGDDRPPALVGSGTEADLRTAMAKAARMADRLVGLRRAVGRSPGAEKG
jgi:hypothetical protein